MTSLTGRIVAQYRILEQIGAGGMGVVYKAEDTRLARFVALKFLPEDLAHDADALERFQREARAASTLDHPNICIVYDVGVDGNRPFIVMQWLDGVTLQQRLDRPMPLDETIELAVHLADALAAAHAAGIVHRDIKPANIFVTSRGQAKILDFGLAKLTPPSKVAPAASQLSTAPPAVDLTRPGAAMGTAAYMSPEQARGEPLDARTDLYSLGCVIYEMATGRRAFPGEPAVVASKALPAGIGRIVSKLLESDRTLRYQAAADVLADLRRLKRDLASADVVRPSARRTRAALAVGAGLSALVVVALMWRGVDPPGVIDSVAVLPFANIDGDPETEYLSDGLTDSLINSLSQVRRLRVVPRSTVFRYKGRNPDPGEAGRALDARAVLTGRITQRGDTLIVHAELVDVANQAQLWGEQYNRRMADVIAIQADITTEISNALRLRLTGEETRVLARSYPQNSSAYQLYLKGLYHRQKTTQDGFEESIKHFRQAIDRDPTYPLAYAGLADTYNSLGYLHIAPPADVWPKSKAAAEAALKLDDTLPEAHAALGASILFYDWDLPRAKRALDRAIELNPGYAIAHHWYAHYWLNVNQFTEVMAASRRAVELEPLDLMLNAHLLFMIQPGTTADALLEAARNVREIEPDFWASHTAVGRALLRQGRVEEALRELEAGVRASGGMPLAMRYLGDGFAQAGRRRDAQRIVAQLEAKPYAPAVYIASIYAALSDKDRTLQWLERGLTDRNADMRLLRTWSKEWQSDPRFQDLVRRVDVAANQ